jgi:HEAT repeat protein
LSRRRACGDGAAVAAGAASVSFIDDREAAMRTLKPLSAAALLALTLLSLICRSAADDKEPIYKGKPLSAWVEQLADRSATARQEAAEALGQIGPAAKPAVGALIAALGDTDDAVRDAAAETLAVFGKDAVGPLTAALKHTDASVRRGAAAALGHMGPDARDAVPALIAMVKNDADSDVREAVVRALGSIGPDAKAAAPALRDALTDKEQHIREAAAAALKRIEK